MREPPRNQYGWYSPLSSHQLRRDKPTAFSFMGHELVAFRDAAGQSCVLQAICPHFGAHLGRGKVVDGCVRCPFHKLDFDRDGQCVGAPPPYDTTKVQHLRTQAWASCERLGEVFVWYGPDLAKPAWELPLDAMAWEEWSPPVTNAGLPMPNVNPIWVGENTVDLAHVRTIHGLHNLTLVEPPRAHDDGTYRVVFDVVWRAGSRSDSRLMKALGRFVNSSFRLDTRLLNPGILVTEATLSKAQGGLRIRTVVLVNPVGEYDAHLRLLVLVHRRFDAAWLGAVERLLGRRPEQLIAQVYLELGMADFRADAAIWQHRRHLSQPVLLKGDGPLVDFRKWEVRFWPDDEAADEAAADVPVNRGRWATSA